MPGSTFTKHLQRKANQIETRVGLYSKGVTTVSEEVNDDFPDFFDCLVASQAIHLPNQIQIDPWSYICNPDAAPCGNEG